MPLYPTNSYSSMYISTKELHATKQNWPVRIYPVVFDKYSDTWEIEDYFLQELEEWSIVICHWLNTMVHDQYVQI